MSLDAYSPPIITEKDLRLASWNGLRRLALFVGVGVRGKWRAQVEREVLRKVDHALQGEVAGRPGRSRGSQ